MVLWFACEQFKLKEAQHPLAGHCLVSVTVVREAYALCECGLAQVSYLLQRLMNLLGPISQPLLQQPEVLRVPQYPHICRTAPAAATGEGREMLPM